METGTPASVPGKPTSGVSTIEVKSFKLRSRSFIIAILVSGVIVAGFFTFRHIEMIAQGKAAPLEIQGKSEDYMRKSVHGTCVSPVQDPLRWDADVITADRICCFNRHFAELYGSWVESSFINESSDGTVTTIFYDSVTGKSLFSAPIGRTREEFIEESINHGWPSFRDAEVNMDNVRVLEDGEVVSVDGTHLGHNLPDKNGNRYCINLVSVAGMPPVNDTRLLLEVVAKV